MLQRETFLTGDSSLFHLWGREHGFRPLLLLEPCLLLTQKHLSEHRINALTHTVSTLALDISCVLFTKSDERLFS